MKNKDEFTVLAVFDSMGEASIMSSLLGSAGIENFLHNDIASSVLSLKNQDTGIRLVVRSVDAEKAKEFLNAKIEKE
jgi:hypothetical protein